MTNKQKTLKRDRARLRNSQNPQQVDYKRMDKIRDVKTEYWKLKKKGGSVKERAKSEPKVKQPKPKKEEKKKEKAPELEVIDEEPELEIIEEEPEIEEIDDELEDLYSYDDELDDEEEDEEE